MSFLARFRVLTKIIAVVSLLSLIASGITWLGVTSLKTMSTATEKMDFAANESLDAQKLAVNLLVINRAEFEISADPRPQSVKIAREAIARERELFVERLKSLKDRATRPDVKSKLTQIESEWVTYQKEIDNIFHAAAAISNVQIPPEMEKLRVEAIASAALANKVRDNIRVLTDSLDKEVNAVTTEAGDEYLRVSRLMMIAAGIGILFGLAGGFVIGQYGIAAPLRDLVGPLDKIAEGNFTVRVPGTGRKDEVGQIAGSVQQMADKVRATIGEIKASGREVTNASAEISTSTTDLSQRTEEQAASLEETSAAMEELSATVRKNAESAQQASQSANATRDVANRGGQVVAQTVQAMAKIEDSSQKITDIIGVIDEIARQTNLLAL
ncbi:MAG: HAMP domain-containing protein, partial [Proteobacteria bacterium]|nr:HAMP domain-containing protein [Pseudomonadota bacterium]